MDNRDLTMWAAIRAFVMFVLVGLACDAVEGGRNETLGDIFATAVADGGKSFSLLTTVLKHDKAQVVNISSWNSQCFDVANTSSTFSTCLQNYSGTCFNLQDVGKLYNVSRDQNLSKEDMLMLSPAIVYSILSCDGGLTAKQNITGKDSTISSKASWGYSFLFVTLINLCSLTGALVLPCMKLKCYKLVLMFMVALAVGTLAGSGLLFLIPEAFLLVHDEDSDYIWKSTTIMFGIYLFYLTEKIMRMINARREDTNLKKRRDELATKGTITTSFRRIPIDNSIPGKDPSQIAETMGGICSSQLRSHSSFHSNNSEDTSPDILRKNDRDDDDDNDVTVDKDWEKSSCNGHSHHHHHHHHHLSSDVAPVAYMIIFGDALHNFIDGLSIGSAFTQSIMTGVSVSVAVMCEELPHELGDFAILLNSGMRFRKALMYNFLSACTCYIGTTIGILLAENTESHEWIFAVAGGMFLYISLVDMMPEMNTAAESDEAKQFGEAKTFILQNCGLLTGYSFMLIFALYGGNIHFG